MVRKGSPVRIRLRALADPHIATDARSFAAISNMTASKSRSTTVVIPVWDDYVKWLDEAIGSAAAFAPPPRILVVDNASEIPVEVGSDASLIRSPSRLSVGAARNVGLEAVETPYVLFLDADDRLLPGALGAMEEILKAEPDCVIAALSVLDGGTGRRHPSPRRFVFRLCRAPRLLAFANAIWSLYPIQSCALMRTAEVRRAGGYADGNWGEDWVLSAAMSFHGRVHVSPLLGRFYRVTRGSLGAGPRSGRDLAASATRVRARLRSDPSSSASLRAALPLIAAAQIVAIYLVRPLNRLWRYMLR